MLMAWSCACGGHLGAPLRNRGEGLNTRSRSKLTQAEQFIAWAPLGEEQTQPEPPPPRPVAVPDVEKGAVEQRIAARRKSDTKIVGKKDMSRHSAAHYFLEGLLDLGVE